METYSKNLDREDVVVWTKEQCSQCETTMRFLERKGIPFEARSLEDEPEILEYARRNGLMQAPIVETGRGDVWSGIRHDKLQQLAFARQKSTTAVPQTLLAASASPRRAIAPDPASGSSVGL